MTENRGHFAQFYCKYKNVSSSDYKIILLLIVAVTMTIRVGIVKKGGGDIGICVLWFMDEDIPRIESRIAFTTQIATNCCNWLCHFNKLTLLCLFAIDKHSIKPFMKLIKNFCLNWNDIAAEKMWLKAIICWCNLWSQYKWGLDHDDIILLEHILLYIILEHVCSDIIAEHLCLKEKGSGNQLAPQTHFLINLRLGWHASLSK